MILICDDFKTGVQMTALEQLESDVKDYGMDVLRARFDRLKARRFVIAKFLRVKILLRRVRILKGQ